MAELDAREQLMLELVNRARMNPLAEAAKYSLNDLNAGLSAGEISSGAKQVLAPNQILEASSTGHSQWMLDVDVFSHTGLNGSSARGRMEAAGYTLTGMWTVGENLAWTGTTGLYNADAQVAEHHKNLFLSAGHRANILNGSYEEVGIGQATGLFTQNGTAFSGMMSTQNFGRTGNKNFVTGVIYNDTDNNDFYSIGESAGARAVELYVGGALQTSTTSSAAGGYALATTSTGVMEVVFSSAGMGAALEMGASNVKVDLVDGHTILSNVSAGLTRGAQNLTLIGIENANATGNDLANILTGNAGNNILAGGAGNDTLIGGSGSDTAVFTGTSTSYTVNFAAASQTYSLTGLDGAVDLVSGVETFQFADGTLSAAQLQGGATIVVTANASTPLASLAEGTGVAKTITFNVSLSGAATATETIDYVIAGHGENQADATDVSGAMSGTLVFAAGETTKSISLTVNTDGAFEANEALAITLSNASGKILIGNATAVVTLNNDDIAPVLRTGDDVDNLLNGTKTTDIMHGHGGHDRMFGGAGLDNLNGGSGNDSLDGGSGADSLNGGEGDDIYVVDNISDIVDETEGGGMDTVLAYINYDLRTAIGAVENLTLSGRSVVSGTGNDLDNVITGNKAANVLTGLGGNDTLNGGRGADHMLGGIGDDTYYVDSAYDRVNESDGNGVDTIISSVSLSLSEVTTKIGDIENLTLSGTKKLSATGNALDNTLTGNDSNNLLLGLGGADVLDGRLGIDTVSYATSTEAVDVSLLRGNGLGGDAQDDTYLSIEGLVGSNFDDLLEGDSFSNLLDGGLGVDTVTYANAEAGVNVHLGSSRNQNTVGSGFDKLRNIENVIGSDFNDMLTGSSLNNVINGGRGNDLMSGGAGADSFVFDAVGFGSDTIVNFQDNVDKLLFSADIAESFEAFTITGNGTNSVQLSLAGDTIQFTSRAILTLAADDFIFG